MPSHSPWGSTEPLVTFFTFFIFSITPDVVTLNRKESKRSISVVRSKAVFITAECLGVQGAGSGVRQTWARIRTENCHEGNQDSPKRPIKPPSYDYVTIHLPLWHGLHEGLGCVFTL